MIGSNPLKMAEADNRSLPQESSLVPNQSKEKDVEMHEEEESGLPAKRAVGISKFGARRLRHGGLVH